MQRMKSQHMDTDNSSAPKGAQPLRGEACLALALTVPNSKGQVAQPSDG